MARSTAVNIAMAAVAGATAVGANGALNMVGFGDLMSSSKAELPKCNEVPGAGWRYAWEDAAGGMTKATWDQVETKNDPRRSTAELINEVQGMSEQDFKEGVGALFSMVDILGGNKPGTGTGDEKDPKSRFNSPFFYKVGGGGDTNKLVQEQLKSGTLKKDSFLKLMREQLSGIRGWTSATCFRSTPRQLTEDERDQIASDDRNRNAGNGAVNPTDDDTLSMELTVYSSSYILKNKAVIDIFTQDSAQKLKTITAESEQKAISNMNKEAEDLVQQRDQMLRNQPESRDQKRIDRITRTLERMRTYKPVVDGSMIAGVSSGAMQWTQTSTSASSHIEVFAQMRVGNAVLTASRGASGPYVSGATGEMNQFIEKMKTAMAKY